MVQFPPPESLLSTARSTGELDYATRGLTAVIRVANTSTLSELDFIFEGAGLTAVRPVDNGKKNAAAVTLSADDDFWALAFTSGRPDGRLCAACYTALKTEGDFKGVIAPYQAGLHRLLAVVLDAARPMERLPFVELPRDTDTAVGRYVWVKANGTEARMYYEEAGSGNIPLLLQATAGADSRQYRYLLADAEMQKRFRMIAYDLPYHGRSMPPSSELWWTQPYKPSMEYLMNWIVGLSDALSLEQPYFMGCSVGGQLALDLAAERPDRFGAFISLNGSYDSPSRDFNNDLFRTPSISQNLAPGLMLGATAPQGPKRNVHEVQWIYGSSYPGIYAGDNDYYMHQHDLKRNGHKIDGKAKPVYLLSGEYDAVNWDEEHGAPAVARHFPSIQWLTLKGQSHFAMTDDPIGFRKELLPILDRIMKQTL